MNDLIVQAHQCGCLLLEFTSFDTKSRNAGTRPKITDREIVMKVRKH